MVRSHAATLATIDAALQRIEYRSLLSPDALRDPTVAPLLDRATSARSVGRMLSLATLVAVTDEAEDAALHVLRQLRHAKAIEHEPALTNRVMACALQGMAIDNANRLIGAGRLETTTAKTLDSALAAVEDRSSLRWALESEQAFSLSQPSSYLRAFERPGVLRLYANALAVVDTPLDELGFAGQRVAEEASSSGAWAAPAIQSLFEAEARVGLQARQLRATLKAKQAGR